MKLAQAIDFSKLFYEETHKNGGSFFIGNPKINLGVDLDFGQIVVAVLPYIFTAAGIALLVFLIFGGISMMLSRGEPKALEAAKAKITGALTGFIILFISYWIVQAVGLILGVSQITDIFK